MFDDRLKSHDNPPSYMSRCFPKPEMRRIILLSQISSRTRAASLTKNRKHSLYILWMFVWAFYTHAILTALKHKMCPHSLQVAHGTSGISTKIVLLFIVNKAAPENILTAARVSTSRRFSFERVRFIFTVNSGPFRGEVHTRDSG